MQLSSFTPYLWGQAVLHHIAHPPQCQACSLHRGGILKRPLIVAAREEVQAGTCGRRAARVCQGHTLLGHSRHAELPEEPEARAAQ